MFKIEFLSSLGQKTELLDKPYTAVTTFCATIDWLAEIRNYYQAYRSSENLNYEDYWCLDIQNMQSEARLNIFTNYMDERQLTENNLSFVVTYYWHELEKTSWFGKLFTGKDEKKVWKSRHIDNASHIEMEQIIKLFTTNDLIRVEQKLHIMGDYDFNVD